MDAEETKQKLVSKFVLPDTSIRSPRTRRVFMEIDYARFREALEYSYNGLAYKALAAITGFDEGENLAFMYHMSNEEGVVLSIKTFVKKADPSLMTITDIFPGADVFERELVDLLGAKVEGLKPGDRYPLTDDWPAGQYPLRKDWKVENLGEGGSCQR